MTSVCVMLNKNCHPEKTEKQAVKRRSFCFVQDLSTHRHTEFISTTVPNNFRKKHLKYNTIKNLDFNKLCPDNNLHI